MTGINQETLDELDRKFANRYNYNREIAIRKYELQERERDDNWGGGSSNIMSKPVEQEVVKFMSDPYIMNRELWKKAIDETLEEQSEEVNELIKEKYWGESSWMDWVSYGKIKGYSKTTIYRLRRKILLSFGAKIGEL